jgi:hypothetical protein
MTAARPQRRTTGTGRLFFERADYASLADRYGFLVIYPTAGPTPASMCLRLLLTATCGLPKRSGNDYDN